jgi:hypothetical protein
MATQSYGLPASVVLFGTIYAVALALAPTSSPAAQHTERPQDQRQIPHITTFGPPPAPTLGRALIVPEVGQTLSDRLRYGGKATLF